MWGCLGALIKDATKDVANAGFQANPPTHAMLLQRSRYFAQGWVQNAVQDCGC